MHPTLATTALCGLLILPGLAGAQTAGGPRLDSDRQQVFQALEDSQWIRLAGPGLGRREGRVLQHSPTEIVLSPEPQSLRVPATSIDTLWTKGTSSKSGALVGGLLGAAAGVLFATQAVEEGETPGAGLGAGYRRRGRGGGWPPRRARGLGHPTMAPPISMRRLQSLAGSSSARDVEGRPRGRTGRCRRAGGTTGRSCAHPDRLGDCIPCNSQPTRSWPGGMMDNNCPYCGISVAGQVRCPLCDTRLASAGVKVSLRRALLWAFVVEEFVLLMVLRRLA